MYVLGYSLNVLGYAFCFNQSSSFLHRDRSSLYWMDPIVQKKSDHSENNQLPPFFWFMLW